MYNVEKNKSVTIIFKFKAVDVYLVCVWKYFAFDFYFMLDVDNKTFIDRSKEFFYMCTVSLTVMLFACKNKNVIAHKTFE